MSNVIIENVGPITQLTIPVPEGGGIIVLQGDNGVGKSEALKATKTLLSGSGTLNKRDGVLANGIVQGFGATIKIGSRTTHGGELEVVSLEDRLNVADLVDPKIINPAAADAKRIKAILALTGVKADITRFAKLLPDIASHVSTVAKMSPDIVEMAATIKRDLEASARQLETKASEDEGAANAIKAAVAGVDMDGEADAKVLAERHSAAIKQQAELNARFDAAANSKQAAQAAKDKLDKATSEYRGPSVAEATETVNMTADACNDAATAYKRAVTQLERATADKDKAGQMHETATRRLSEANKQEAFVASIQTILSADQIEEPDFKQIVVADEAVNTAELNVQRGALIRDAKVKSKAMIGYGCNAAEHRAKAEAIRKACAGVDAVLSQAVACDSLKVVDGRLVTETDARGQTYYQDLSDGQRWKIALDIAIEAVGERGVLVIPQPAWEGLSPKNRNMIAEHVQGKQVTVITAQSANGPLRAEQFEAI